MRNQIKRSQQLPFPPPFKKFTGAQGGVTHAPLMREMQASRRAAAAAACCRSFLLQLPLQQRCDGHAIIIITVFDNFDCDDDHRTRERAARRV